MRVKVAIRVRRTAAPAPTVTGAVSPVTGAVSWYRGRPASVVTVKSMMTPRSATQEVRSIYAAHMGSRAALSVTLNVGSLRENLGAAVMAT